MPANNPHAASSAIVLFAHGSRDAQWARPFRTIQDAIKTRQPGAAVELAFLEFMEPTLDSVVSELVATGHGKITVAPLFMAQGAHLKNDLAGMLDAMRARHRDTEIVLLPAIGEVGTILDTIADWLVVSTIR